MPFEMTRRCVNLGTEGILLDLTGRSWKKKGGVFHWQLYGSKILEDRFFTRISGEMRCFFGAIF